MSIIIESLSLESILEEVSFSLEDHQLTLIIGRSGSGKSTLLRALAGLVKVDSGTILYDKVPLWSKGKMNRELLLQLAIAFQSPEHQLFAQTVKGEFDYSLRPYRLSQAERTRRTEETMQKAQLPSSMLMESPFELSGGQKRRVALTTLLATNPTTLLLDEPSAGLDAAATARLKQQLVELKQNKTIVMATHDWEYFLPVADRVIILADGRLLANLSPTELLESPNILEQAGVGVPDAMKVVYDLQRKGISMPMQLLPPEQMAEEIISRWDEANNPDGSSIEQPPTSRLALEDSSQPLAIPTKRIYEATSLPRRWVYRVEARLKWLIYMVVSIIILLQYRWDGMVPTMIFTIGILSLLRKDHIIRVIRLCKPLVLFIIVAAAFSGVGVSRAGDFWLSFDVAASLLTVHRMLPLLEVTLASFVFSMSTSTTEMKRGLEKALSGLERFGIPTAMLALAASLVLRFIPMILEETERFSLIAAARGKRIVRKGQIRLRDVHVFTIPLLISLFQMVEDLIMALEIKGFTNKKNGKGT